MEVGTEYRKIIAHGRTSARILHSARKLKANFSSTVANSNYSAVKTTSDTLPFRVQRFSAMPIVEGSILIKAPPDGVFALSQDYGLRREWDPFVRDMRFASGAVEAGLGVEVWVRAWTGLTMTVQFTSFRPPNSVAMKMVRGPWFFRRFGGTWLFKADARAEPK